MQDDDEPTADEQAQAEALARALAGEPEGQRPPPEALDSAALLGFARSGGTADPARLAAVRDRTRADVLAGLRPRRKRRWWAWMSAPLAAGAAAGLVLATRPAPRFSDSRWPAPPAALLETQAAAARGERGALGRLDEQMRVYRQALLAGARPPGEGRR
jgi:hypothetical protein